MNQIPNIEEIETKLWKAFNERKPFAYEEALEELKQNHHQQLQKARDTWHKESFDRGVVLGGEQSRKEEREKIKAIIQDESNRGTMFGSKFEDIIHKIDALDHSELDQDKV